VVASGERTINVDMPFLVGTRKKCADYLFYLGEVQPIECNLKYFY
jgi:hypothetical protein